MTEPAAGYTPPPSGGMPDLKALPPFELGILVTGVLTFIVSFFPYYGGHASSSTIDGIKVGGGGSSFTAWHSYSTLALLLILIATGVAAAAIFAKFELPGSPIGVRWIAAAVSSLGALLYLLRLFTLSHHSYSGFGYHYSYGVKWGGYLLLLIVLANAACAVISALSSDETVPWAGLTGGSGAAPAGVYSPPPAGGGVPPAPPTTPPTAPPPGG